MALIDHASISVKGGDGGAGKNSMRREKYVPLGGPNGGDGGHGGSGFLEATTDLRTLIDYSYLKHYEGPNGDKGGKFNCTGKSGDDIVLRVPCGTLVKDANTGEVVVDMVQHGQKFMVAKGGRGGRGNTH